MSLRLRKVRLLLISLLPSCARAPDPLHPHPTCTQLLLVRTAQWEATEGRIRRFERPGREAPWRAVGEPRPVTVGRSGLGWGGDSARRGPVKREGDGRSPAGLFPLGVAFGTAPGESIRWIRLPYLPLLQTTECVDDPASVHYNALVDRAGVPRPDWKSSERMREVGEAYRLGIFVGHNVAPARAGLGSCIFLHLWSGEPAPTAGCTAMAAKAMEELLRWLDPRAEPALLQLPEEEFAKFSGLLPN